MDEITLLVDDGMMEVCLDLAKERGADLFGNIQLFFNSYSILLYTWQSINTLYNSHIPTIQINYRKEL